MKKRKIVLIVIMSLSLSNILCMSEISPTPPSRSMSLVNYRIWAIGILNKTADIFEVTADGWEYGNQLDQMTATRRAISSFDKMLDEARTITPPYEMKSVHANIIQALDQCIEGVQDYAEGDFDSSTLNLTYCGSTLNDVKREVE